MKRKRLPFLLLMTAFIAFSGFVLQTQKEPWTKNQLMATADLAAILKVGEQKVYIYNIGPAGSIKNAIKTGDAKEKDNLQKLKKAVAGLSKDENIVIYCGCCPFKDCPNIRPAFMLLNEMGFTNHKLLNIPQNLKIDWIDKGYPMNP